MSPRIYSFLLRLLSPLLITWLAVRGLRNGQSFRALDRERFGFVARGFEGAVWVHAVSVGETRAAAPLVQALLGRGERVLLTHMTPTGRDAGATLFADVPADRLRQVWLPYDFPGVCRRFLGRARPRLLILIEREVWPNLVATCQQAGVPVALVSARLSERALRRAMKAGSLLTETYRRMTLVCAQHEKDAIRLQQLGAPDVQVTGNLKFDVQVDFDLAERGRRWRSAIGRPVIVLASTREGEDIQFATAWQALRTKRAAHASSAPLLLVVPRHPQRFDAAVHVFGAQGLRVVRRSSLPSLQERIDADVVVGDSMGEMAMYIGASDVAVMGGTFEPFGGQNLLEPCALGVPVVLGPSIHNFEDAAEEALAHGAAQHVDTVGSALELAWNITDVPHDAANVPGGEWMRRSVGATRRILDLLPLD